MCIKPIIVETEDSIAMNRWSWSGNDIILLRNIPTEFKEYLHSKYSAEIREVGYDVYDADTKEIIDKKRWYAITVGNLDIKVDGYRNTTTEYFYLYCEKLSEIYKDYLYENNLIELDGTFFSKKKIFNVVVMKYSLGYYPVEDKWFR